MNHPQFNPRPKTEYANSRYNHHQKRRGSGGTYTRGGPSGVWYPRGGYQFSGGYPNRRPFYPTKIEITKEAEAEVRKLNSDCIKRQDKDFRVIVNQACQSAIYIYKIGEGWLQTTAAGSLMLYERDASPRMAFIVFNRMKVSHWQHFFTPKTLEVQLKGKYLLFKDGPKILCIWFYVEAEAALVCGTMTRFGAKLLDNAEVDEETRAPGNRLR